MSEAYAEAIVTLAPAANADHVRSWFEKHGFGISRMTGGLLVSGTGALFAKKLGIPEDHIAARQAHDVLLGVPDDLLEFVTSIVIRRSPSIQG
jgi:hypothetical protein